MQTYTSKTDFKKLEYKTWTRIFFIVLISLITAYFRKELSPRKNRHISRTTTVIIAGTIDIALIAFVLNIKKIKSITFNQDKQYIEIEFISGLYNCKKKKAHLKSLRYKLESEQGNQTLVLTDKKDFNFIITEDEYSKEEQNEILNYIKKQNPYP